MKAVVSWVGIVCVLGFFFLFFLVLGGLVYMFDSTGVKYTSGWFWEEGGLFDIDWPDHTENSGADHNEDYGTDREPNFEFMCHGRRGDTLTWAVEDFPDKVYGEDPGLNGTVTRYIVPRSENGTLTSYHQMIWFNQDSIEWSQNAAGKPMWRMSQNTFDYENFPQPRKAIFEFQVIKDYWMLTSEEGRKFANFPDDPGASSIQTQGTVEVGYSGKIDFQARYEAAAGYRQPHSRRLVSMHRLYSLIRSTTNELIANE